MTGLAVLLAMGLAGFAGSAIGIYRAAVAAGVVLVSGLIAFNAAGPVADAAGSNQPATLVGVVAVLFPGAAGFLGLFAWAISPGKVRAPWLMDRIGGACCGAVAGWLVAGMAVASLRTLPPFDEYVRSSRPEGADYAFSYADGAWTEFVVLASTRGLAREPTTAYSPPGFVQKHKGTQGTSSRGED